jgi:hypothetical protein
LLAFRTYSLCYNNKLYVLFGPCRRCNKKHNSIIHSDEPNTSSSAVSLFANQVEPTDSLSAAHNSASQLLVSTTALASCFPDKTIICENIDSFQSVNKSHTVMHNLSMQPVLLSTAIIEVADKHRNFHKARALLDNGSQRCFKTQAFCERLDIADIQSTHEIRGVGNSVAQSTQVCDIEIKYCLFHAHYVFRFAANNIIIAQVLSCV